MLNPALVDLTVWRTGTYDTRLAFYKDEARTEPYSLTEYTVSVVIEGGPTLTVGSGLTVTENEIAIHLTGAQTGALNNLSRCKYTVRLVKGEEVLFPVHGTMSFETP